MCNIKPGEAKPVQFWPTPGFWLFDKAQKVFKTRLHTLYKNMQTENIKGIDRYDQRICNIWMITCFKWVSKPDTDDAKHLPNRSPLLI